jgi:hypothetical protein
MTRLELLGVKIVSVSESRCVIALETHPSIPVELTVTPRQLVALLAEMRGRLEALASA